MRPQGGSVTLEARAPERNLARSWAISAGPDLLGWTVVSWRWGRIGKAGQARASAFADPAEAQRFARHLLLRRARAPRRIGVPYRVICCA
ncbi:WGR domain-containing protein [uncultured Novosphingobium sp.]|uniref:WGR domain-containing protein n=1 Tax=uncultured Novosphingobium sp. TaxID=292277 RepID=UPI00258BE589|nr:WGR domain-containing protein [uncultured Novosphingobium sp.]